VAQVPTKDEDRGRRELLPRPAFLVLDMPAAPFRKRLLSLKSIRSFWDNEVEAVAKFIRPRRMKRFWENGRPPGEERQSEHIVNTTATIASRTLRSGMQSGASSPARPWFKLTTPDPDLAESGDVKAYLTTVARRMATVFTRSNIYNCLHTGYGDLGDFGTSCMMIDENYDNVIRCHVYSPGEYCLAADDEGNITTVYREFELSVLACVRRWGRRCSDNVLNAYDNSNYDQMVQLCEAIEPNMHQVRDMRGPRGLPFIRVVFEAAGNDALDGLLECKGCHEFPGCTPRWEVRDNDVYGTGPGIEALGDVKGLQMLEVRKQIIVDKLATPPTQGGPDSIKVRNRAGQHTAVGGMDTSTRPVISALYDMNPTAITAIAAEIARSEQRIREVYFADLFLMMSQSDRREITAREVDERHEEKLLALGPVIERLHNENLDPAISRTFNIMHRAGILPDPPQELQGMDLKVQFISTLAQAQRAVAVQGIERMAGFVGGLVAVFPSVADKFDADQAVDEYAEATGIPAGVVRSDDQVDTIREGKQKADQGAAAAQAAVQGADTAKVLADTQVTDQNMLGQILGGAGAFSG
jgi:hypothetical protein